MSSNLYNSFREDVELSSPSFTKESPREFQREHLPFLSLLSPLILSPNGELVINNIPPPSTPIVDRINKPILFSDTTSGYSSSHTDVDNKLILHTLDDLKKHNMDLRTENINLKNENMDIKSELYKKIYDLEEKNINLKGKVSRLVVHNDLLEEDFILEDDKSIYYIITGLVASSLTFLLTYGIKYYKK